MTVIRVAQPCRTFRYGIEHRLKIRGRAGNDSQNLARGGLLLQRLGKIAVPFLQFLEQPNILDGNNGLGGEGFKKLDLFFGKRTHFSPANDYRTDGAPLPQ